MDSRSFRAWLVGTSVLSAVTLYANLISAEEIGLDTITVTSTRTEDKAVNTLAGASVVTETELKRHQPDRLSGVLNAVPGVNVQEDSDDPASVINIRGLQDFGRVNVLIEGARQNFQRSGHGGNGQIYLEPELIKKVDITRGPVSTIYGSGAIGGVINFGLVDPSDIIEPGETWALQQKGLFNSNRDGFLSSTTFAAQPHPAFGVVGNFVYRNDPNYTDGNGNTVPFTSRDVISGLVKGKWDISDETRVEFIHLRQHYDYTSGALGVVRQTDTEDESIIVRAKHTSADNPLIDVTLSGYYTTTLTEQVEISGGLTPGNRRSFEINTAGTDVFNTSRFSTGEIQHAVTYGADVFRDEVVTADPGGNGDEFTPSGERIAYGFYIQDEITYSSWFELILALRYDGYQLRSAIGNLRVNDTNLAPKVTLGLTPFAGVQVYGTYAEGYRAPAISETLIQGNHPPPAPFALLPNPNLQPETAQNLEAGINLSFDGVIREDDRFRGKANVYHNEIDNFIGDVFLPPFIAPPAGSFQYVNIAKAEIYGFEVEALYDFNIGFLQASYSYTKGDDKTANQPLDTIYPHKFVGTLGFRFLDDALTVGGRLTSVAAQNRIPPPAGNPLILPSRAYDLVDLFATYDHNRYFSTAITLKNITDQQYVPFRQVQGTPSPGFAALLSATVKIGG
ncbi:MAG: TonB-dependent hemoglobin/transferrin/lactoferrin family receptor [Pseudomonadota bacterium]